MNDLLKLMQTGLDMGGTDKAWYAGREGLKHPKAPKNPPPAISNEKLVLARWFRSRGHTWQWIAQQVGCHESTLRRRCGRDMRATG